MRTAIRLFNPAGEVTFTQLKFPGGEPHVAVPQGRRGVRYILDATLRTADDLVMLLALTDAVRRNYSPASLRLILQYFPGARQDRVEYGTALTASVYAKVINSQQYDSVVIADPHSNVTPALVDRCTVIGVGEIVARFSELRDRQYAGVISPDVGAEKRTQDAAKALGTDVVVRGSKVRDPRTGRLSAFRVEAFPSAGRYLIVDDICDGGGTFIGLADACGDVPLDLYVTHGIFSKGFDALLDRFERIFTSDSFATAEQVEPHRDRVIVLPTSDFIRSELWNSAPC